MLQLRDEGMMVMVFYVCSSHVGKSPLATLFSSAVVAVGDERPERAAASPGLLEMDAAAERPKSKADDLMEDDQVHKRIQKLLQWFIRSWLSNKNNHMTNWTDNRAIMLKMLLRPVLQMKSPLLACWHCLL